MNNHCNVLGNRDEREVGDGEINLFAQEKREKRGMEREIRIAMEGFVCLFGWLVS